MNKFILQSIHITFKIVILFKSSNIVRIKFRETSLTPVKSGFWGSHEFLLQVNKNTILVYALNIAQSQCKN